MRKLSEDMLNTIRASSGHADPRKITLASIFKRSDTRALGEAIAMEVTFTSSTRLDYLRLKAARLPRFKEAWMNGRRTGRINKVRLL